MYRQWCQKDLEKLGVWDELHDHYSPAASCRSKLRFWVSLKVAYVFICEECSRAQWKRPMLQCFRVPVCGLLHVVRAAFT